MNPNPRPFPLADRHLTPEEAFLRRVTLLLPYFGGTWKNAVNRVLLSEGGRPRWKDELFDTFTDHLFDLLREAGHLRVGDTRTRMEGRPPRLPEAWLNEDDAGHMAPSIPSRLQLAQRALRLAHRAYEPSAPGQLSPCA